MVAEIVGAIQAVLAQAQAPVGLHEPRFAGRALAAGIAAGVRLHKEGGVEPEKTRKT